jgi:hypothetical protein
MFRGVPADLWIVTADDLVQVELMLNRFRRLISELLKGIIPRNHFEPWEVGILLDIETCDLDPRRRPETLRRYQKAVERQLETGPGPPMKLSEFLERSNRRAV